MTILSLNTYTFQKGMQICNNSMQKFYNLENYIWIKMLKYELKKSLNRNISGISHLPWKLRFLDWKTLYSSDINHLLKLLKSQWVLYSANLWVVQSGHSHIQPIGSLMFWDVGVQGRHSIIVLCSDLFKSDQRASGSCASRRQAKGD